MIASLSYFVDPERGRAVKVEHVDMHDGDGWITLRQGEAEFVVHGHRSELLKIANDWVRLLAPQPLLPDGPRTAVDL